MTEPQPRCYGQEDTREPEPNFNEKQRGFGRDEGDDKNKPGAKIDR